MRSFILILVVVVAAQDALRIRARIADIVYGIDQAESDAGANAACKLCILDLLGISDVHQILDDDIFGLDLVPPDTKKAEDFLAQIEWVCHD